MQNIVSYIEQLNLISQATGIELREGFRLANIHHSTFHRTKTGQTELKFRTAKAVGSAMVDHGKCETTGTGA